LDEIREWFRTIKTYDGKPENEFGYGGKFLSAERALEIIDENHKFY
jgi:inorganic pyrophosphatase